LKSYWKNGKRDGFYDTWYRNGQKKLQGYYMDGKVVGRLSEWDEEGLLHRYEVVK